MSVPFQRLAADDAGGMHPERGRLHLFLAAAPGAGKTYALLVEGHRLAATGRDVVIGVAEAHGRPATAALAVGLESVPLRVVAYHGATFEDLDVPAVLARCPQVVLVDELAQAAIPGGRHDARWQDVEELLAAGIDVVSCLNVQHLESLGEAVRSVTGAAPTATLPDAVVAASDRIDLIDLWPGELRERIGRLYPPATAERALAGYYQAGNLLALRSMARRWMTEHGFDGPAAVPQGTPQS